MHIYNCFSKGWLDKWQYEWVHDLGSSSLDQDLWKMIFPLYKKLSPELIIVSSDSVIPELELVRSRAKAGLEMLNLKRDPGFHSTSRRNRYFNNSIKSRTASVENS